ncbi:MAG: magnesium transporter [Gammaproteobacteria bacterium]|nr:magnesium transporter [Gammaproteobacteria bacterium]
MTPDNEIPPDQQLLHELSAALGSEDQEQAAQLLAEQHPSDVAELLESIPSSQRGEVWELLEPEHRDSVFTYTEDTVRSERLRQMAPDELASVAEGLEVDDVADILQDLPESMVEEVLASMDEQNRRRLEQVLSYDEDSAGGLMNVDVLTVRADVSLEVVARYLRRKGEVPEHTDSLMVVDRDNVYLGRLPLSAIIINDPATPVAQVMNTEAEGIPVETSERDVAKLFEHRDFVSAAVVDDDGVLLGRITVDDVLDVIRDEGEHQLMGMAGLSEEEDMFAPVMSTTRRRALWLGVNLATAFLAAWVIGLFEATIQEVVALAVLMPIVASMGGIAGSQTLTVVIRGMALGQLGSRNTRYLFTKEVAVGALNGLVWAVVVGLVAGWWFGNLGLAIIIAVAMVVNLVVAALFGAAIPLLLKRFDIDPALAGGVVLTTVTDVVGFMTFLGLGTVFLLG